MRITCTIDDDVLSAVEALARQQRRSVGEVVSDLLRQSLFQSTPKAEYNGVPLLPVSNPAARVTLRMVNVLRDEEE